jgi:Family of unknown function (DUF5715)
MRAIVPPPRRRARWPWRTLILVGSVGFALVPPGPPSLPLEPAVVAPEGTSDVMLLSWREAARRVEEKRGEGVGNQVVVPVPPELRHYDDRRRFLAVQAAETREQDYPVPQDEADLAALARKGELVEMEPVGETYVLYGVGAHASSEPFAHYDRESGLEIPLYADYLAFEHGDEAFDDAVHEALDRREHLQAERARLARRTPSRRRALGVEMASLQRTADGLIRVQERAAALYEDYGQRRRLSGKLHLLEETARDLGPRPYDLDDAGGRRALRGRLLSLIRPEARDLLLEIAGDYHAAFGRPLPVTSLVRSQRYQALLRRTNSNATTMDPPPHASGLAFDVYTGHMTATEQAYLLLTTARLEQAGRVEALFERNRDHIHIFVFADGVRPPETLIAQSLGQIRPAAAPRRPTARARGAVPAAMARPSLPGLGGGR